MKKLVVGLLLIALLAALITALILWNLSKDGEKTLEQELLAMSPEERAEVLLSRSRERLDAAESYTLSITSTVSLTTPSHTSTSLSRLVSHLSGIGTDGFACHSETEMTCSISGEETTRTAIVGYQSGTVYLASEEDGNRIRLRSPLPLADYLAFARAHLLSPIDPLAPEHYTLLSSTVEKDGSYTVSLSAPSKDGVSSLNMLLKSEQALLDVPHRELESVTAELRLARDLTPTSIVITCLFGSPEESLVSLEISVSLSGVNATAAPAAPTDLHAYYTVSDLRPLYLLETALKERTDAASGAFVYELDQAVTLGEDGYSRQTTERGIYSHTNGKTAYSITVDDGTSLQELSYRDGSRHIAIKDRETAAIIEESAVSVTEQAATAYLAERLHAAGYRPARVTSVSPSGANTYTLRLANPDLSAYEDVIGLRSVAATATLTVTLTDGKLTRSVYTLEIRSTVGNTLSILHTATCSYYNVLPE